MSQFVLSENNGKAVLIKKTQVLAEVCGKVTYVNPKNKTLFSIHAEKMDKKFRCKLVYTNPFCPLREGDAVLAIAEFIQDSRYGDTLNILQPPFVILGEDKATTINNFVLALKGTGFGPLKANQLYDTLHEKSNGNIISSLTKLASYYNYSKNENMDPLIPYSIVLKDKQMLKLLEWWYKNYNMRRLWLLGINNKEIYEAKIPPEDIYAICLENPYKIFSLSIDKCDNIMGRLGKEIDPVIRKCGEVSRKIYEYMNHKGWTGIPTKILLEMFPDVTNYIDKLRDTFGIKTELYTAYLPYAHEIETYIADKITTILSGDKLPHSINSDEITYTRNDLSDNQKMAIERALSENICIITGVAGSGKCLDPHTPILMANGEIKAIMDTKIGDLVMGPDSKPRTILSRCNGSDKMYKIIPTKGKEFICNEPHILTLKGIKPYLVFNETKKSPHIVKFTVKGLHKTKAFKVLEDAKTFKRGLTEDIFDISLDEYLKRKSEVQRYNYLFHVGVDFPENEIPFDPYAIGMWLGDGTSSKADITNIDKEILDKLEIIFNGYGLTMTPRTEGSITYRVIGVGDNYRLKGGNAFACALRDLNLFNNKHIPDIYKINSRRVRMEVLAGLIDSDGYNSGNFYEIFQKNKQLASDIEYLALSLGFMVVSKEVTKGCMYKGEMRNGLYQRITIFGDNIHEIPVVLERKKCYVRKSKSRATCQRFKVELVGTSPYQGFELDGDGRFLLGDFKVTHNSSIIKEIIYNLDQKGISYKVCSFTGKAVSRIREIVDKKDPMTMHMAITMGSKKPVPFHHLIIDEASMVTSELLYDFMQKFPHDYRITMIGDPNQLLPIGFGAMFDQLIKSGVVPKYTLTRCYRTVNNKDSGIISGILTNASNIIECADPQYNGPPFDFEETEDFKIVDGDLVTIKELITILKSYGISHDKIVIISPFNKDLNEINKICQDIYNDSNRFLLDGMIKWLIGDRVMMTENNYVINIMNGDEGIITDLSANQVQVTFKDGSSHIFLLGGGPADSENNIEVNNKKDLTTSSLIHSFGTSVHKFQGSESDYVIFYVPESKQSKFLNRNLFYTGVTRARKAIWIVGDYNTMINACKTSPAYRCDNLSQRLIINNKK